MAIDSCERSPSRWSRHQSSGVQSCFVHRNNSAPILTHARSLKMLERVSLVDRPDRTLEGFIRAQQ